MLLLLACAAPPAPPPPDEPVTVFVQASTLNLRAEPAADARKVGRIVMNSPVRVEVQRGEWTRVRTANEKVGWVTSSYLGTRPIPLADAVARAASATDPAERLSWAQRAAALAPEDPATLRALAAAYRATGDDATAARVEARAAWPEILPVVQPSEVDIEVELQIGDARLVEGTVPATAVDPAWAWWVLPDRGAAVPARLGSVRWAPSNECGGTATLRASLIATLPAGAVAIAATHTTPPLAWRQDQPPLDRKPLQDRILALAREAGAGDGLVSSVAPTPSGWHARAAWEGKPSGADDELFPPSPGVDALLAPDGTVLSSRRATYDGLAPELPLAERDLDGDGTAETVWDNQCQTRILGADGALLSETDFRCCGC